MDTTWTLYAVFGFLIFVAVVVAPVVRHLDKKRRRQRRHQNDNPTA